MAVLKYGSIILDSPRSVFYAGQVISGRLEIEIETPLRLSVIYVNFLGEAKVYWTEKETDDKLVEYVGREEYFKGSQLLAGSYGSVLNFNPGKYSYPFQYQLPRGIPSSYTGDRGGIVYSVTGHVEFQGQILFKDEIVKLFEVVAPFDLNKGNEFVKEPIEMEFEEVSSCGCFCSSEPVSVRVRLPVSAYCPGQTIPVSVAVENKSSMEITQILFELLSRQRYRTQRPVAEYVQPEEILLSLKKGSVMSGNKRNFTVDLVVPDLIVPNLEDCSIIDVGYFFRITVKLSGCNEDMQDEAEICLGLVPLNETLDGPYVHPMAHSLPIDPIPDEDTSNIRQETTPQLGFQTVPDGTSYFVQVNQQVTSSDPSQNYEMGFKVAYPPGSEIPPAFNQQFNQFSQSQTASLNVDMKIQMDDLMKTHKFVSPHMDGFPAVSNSFAPPNGFTPRGKSPVPTAPPL